MARMQRLHLYFFPAAVVCIVLYTCVYSRSCENDCYSEKEITSNRFIDVASSELRVLPADFKEATWTNISDIFAPVGETYRMEKGVIYDCLSNTPYKTFKPPSRISEFKIPSMFKTGLDASSKRRDDFQLIFEEQIWQPVKDGNKTAKDYKASGQGSSLEAAQSPLSVLFSLIDRLKIFLNKPVITMVDIPCGDFFWMRELIGRRSDVQYTGIDIVAPLIEKHKKEYESMKNAQFKNLDIVQSGLDQSYDIIFSRDMLQHLSNADVFKILDHFSASGSKLLIASNLLNEENGELTDNAQEGRYRHLNLLLPPVNLVPPLCAVMDDPWHSLKDLAVWKLPLKQRA